MFTAIGRSDAYGLVILGEFIAEGGKRMKRLKKFIICLLSVVVLCGSQMTYVSAAETEVMSLNAFVCQDAKVGNVVVTFTFDYVDGTTAKLAMVVCHNSNYDMPNPPTSYFANDRCYASVVVVNKTTNEQITLRAWCDIYGQTGEY